MKPLAPREADALVAAVNEGSSRAAAASLGIALWTYRDALKRARAKLGALSTTHAAALAFPQLHDRYRERGR